MPKPRMTDGNFDMVADRFRLLGEPLRLKILYHLGKDELSVGEIARRAGISQPSCSRHLAALLVHGMVRRRRQGTSVFYSVADSEIFRICDVVCGSIERALEERGRALG